jgi:hypothetical protein
MGFVADIISDVGDAVGDVFEAVGDVVEGVGDVVGDALEYVGNTVEAVIEDPLPTLISIAGAAIGIPPPLTSAAITAAKGGDLEDIVLSAGTSYAAGQAGKFVSSNISPAISQTLTSAGVEDAVLNKAITDAASRGLTSGIISEIRGGDFEQGALSGLTGSLVTSGVKEFGSELDPTLQKTISSGLTAAALGQDPSAAISNTLIKEGLSSPLIKQGLQSIADDSWGVNQQIQSLGETQSPEISSYSTPYTDGSYSLSGDAEAQEGDFYGTPTAYTDLEGYSPDLIKQLYEGTYAGTESSEAEAREQLGDLYSLVYPDGYPTLSSVYEGLGYDADLIKQLYEGTYAGSESSEAEARDQLGDLYNLVYSDGYPTSSSAYEGLGYDANTINQLMSGTYYGPEQTEAEVRQQMGDELFNLAYPYGYNAATSGYSMMPTTTSGTRTTSGTKTTGGLGGIAVNNQNQNIADTFGGGQTPIAQTQANLLFTGQPMQQAGKDYGQIIRELASVLGQKGYKVGGSVHVPGPEGKLYAKHETRGFAVGGPGTGQSDDIPTMLSDGEYVFDADTVAALGDGSSKAGAEILDKFRQEIRSHKRSAPADRIPPKAKSPLAYLKAAKKSKG